MSRQKNIKQALSILKALGLPQAQCNERSALCLLALLNITPKKTWKDAENPLIGITPMIKFSREYGWDYAPNTRETFRRQTMHQFVQAGIALYNPDNPERPVNSPKAVYQIEQSTLELVCGFGGPDWAKRLGSYLKNRGTLAQRYAKEREASGVPVQVAKGKEIRLTAGEHSELIRAVIESFVPRFMPGARLVYVGDTGSKWGYFDELLLGKLGVTVDSHGKMPDVILFYPDKNWLCVIESVTSHGPVDGKRHQELATLFASSEAQLVFVTAFPSRSIMAKYLTEIAWETEVWCADSPSHLIHFNGVRFLGPY